MQKRQEGGREIERGRRARGVAQSGREIGTENAGGGRQKAPGKGVGDSRISDAGRGQEGARG